MVIMTVMLTFIASSCNDDDINSVIGTWKVTSCNKDGFRESFVNRNLVFESNGNVSGSALDDYYKDNGYRYYAKWKMDGNTLTIILGCDGPDDNTVGTFSISGRTAVYNFYTEDSYGKWSNKYNADQQYVMKLERQ